MITGLQSAIAYAEAVAAAHAAHGTNEAFTTALTLAEYEQAVVDAVAAARHASTTAAAAWTAAAAELDAALAVRDAYAAVPDAGDKHHLLTADGADGARSTVTGSGAARTGATTTGRTAEMSHTGAPQPAAAASAARRKGPGDPLRIGGRIVLDDGERFVASGSAKDNEGMLVLAAAVDTPTGRVVHIGVPVHEESKAHWKGAHAPATEVEPDEEFPDDPDEAHTVDTYADNTAVIEAAAAARLPAHVEELIEVATAVDKDYRQVARRYEKLDDERRRLEGKRFTDPADAERKLRLDQRRDHHEKYQRYRREHMEACRARLDPDARARYDELQRQIDAAGRDAFEPGRQAQAAVVCGLTVAEYRELYELRKTHYTQRTPRQEQRVDELDDHYRKPPLLAEQAAIVHGLTIDEYREMEDLDRIGQIKRTREQQARYEELRAGSPRGATFANPEQTSMARSRYETYQEAHHSTKMEWAQHREELAALEAKAGPLDAADAARLAELTAECDVVGAEIDELTESTVTVQVPGRNGATLVIQAAQREEDGGVDYRVGTRPANAPDDWSPGDTSGDPYCTTAGGVRKVAKLAAGLAAAPAVAPATVER